MALITAIAIYKTFAFAPCAPDLVGNIAFTASLSPLIARSFLV